MGLVGLVTDREPPAGRASHCDGPLERHLSEAGVMLAVAEWMFGLGAEAVEIHPDGMHVKQFDMCRMACQRWVREGGRERQDSGGGALHAQSPEPHGGFSVRARRCRRGCPRLSNCSGSEGRLHQHAPSGTGFKAEEPPLRSGGQAAR